MLYGKMPKSWFILKLAFMALTGETKDEIWPPSGSSGMEFEEFGPMTIFPSVLWSPDET